MGGSSSRSAASGPLAFTRESGRTRPGTRRTLRSDRVPSVYCRSHGGVRSDPGTTATPRPSGGPVRARAGGPRNREERHSSGARLGPAEGSGRPEDPLAHLHAGGYGRTRHEGRGASRGGGRAAEHDPLLCHLRTATQPRLCRLPEPASDRRRLGDGQHRAAGARSDDRRDSDLREEEANPGDGG